MMVNFIFIALGIILFALGLVQVRHATGYSNSSAKLDKSKTPFRGWIIAYSYYLGLFFMFIGVCFFLPAIIFWK